VKHWKVILATLVIFGAGIVTGGLAGKRIEAPPPPFHRPGMQRVEVLRRMEKRLDLNLEQRQRIEQILCDSQERMSKLWEQVGPKMREEFHLVNKRISEELTPEQKKKFEELIKEQRSKHRPEEPPWHNERNRPAENRDRRPRRGGNLEDAAPAAPQPPSK
jgi:Spy/CpxP family protein refolding chaperone